MTTPKPDIREQIKAAVEKRRAAMLPPGPARSDTNITSEIVNQCFDCNELGDGILYSKLNQDRYRYNKTDKTWYRWAGHHWEIDEKDRHRAAGPERVVEKYLALYDDLAGKVQWAQEKGDKDQVDKLAGRQKKIEKRINKLRSNFGVNSCIAMAVDNPNHSIAITSDQLDTDPYLFACANGVIDLRLGELRAGDPSDYITKNSPVEWQDLHTPAPAFEQFLHDILLGDESMISYLQRLLGYSITGTTVEHVLPVFWGEAGRNGKGTLIKLLQHVLGDYCAAIQSEMLLQSTFNRSSAGPSPDLLRLRGIRLALASETDEGRRFSPARCKWLSGGDQIVARGLQEKYETAWDPSHTLMLLTNHRPDVPSDDSAFWERCHLVPFRVSFVRRQPQGDFERPADIHIADKLKQESAGILAWLVRGCLMWQEIGLDPPEIVREATAEYRREMDYLSDWIDEACVLGDHYSCGATEAYSAFSEWWESRVGKREKPKMKKFGMLMAKKFERKRTSAGNLYAGLSLIDDWGV